MLYWRWFSQSWSLGLLLGLVLANSSTALVIQILERKNELDQEHGQASFAVLLFQDLTVVPITPLCLCWQERDRRTSIHCGRCCRPSAQWPCFSSLGGKSVRGCSAWQARNT